MAHLAQRTRCAERGAYVTLVATLRPPGKPAPLHDHGTRSAIDQQRRGYSTAALSWVLAGLCVWRGLAAVGLVLAVFGALLVRMLSRHRRTANLFSPLAQARQALDAGDSARCKTLLDQLEAARPPPELRLWIGILRAHVAFNEEDPAAAAAALDQARSGVGGTLRGAGNLGAIVLALRALAHALLGQPELAREALAAHDAHPARTADTAAPARLAELLILDQSGDERAQAVLLARSATALLNRLGPAQRPLVRALAVATNRPDVAHRTAVAPDSAPPRSTQATTPRRVAVRIHPVARLRPRSKAAVTIAAAVALIFGAFWLPEVLAWQGLGIALFAVVAFAVYGTTFRRGHLRGARQLQAARLELVWGDHRQGHRELVALASGRDDYVAIDACVHLAIDAEERGDLEAAFDACDAGLARIAASRVQLETQAWTAPKLAELQAYLRAAQGELDRSQRELAALRATFPDYAFLVAGIHRIRLMQAANARNWPQVAELEANRARAMTISARDELLARVGSLLAHGATEASDLAGLEAELEAFPSHERWLEAVAPGALRSLRLGAPTTQDLRTTPSADSAADGKLDERH
jgi:hypothetical protein